MTDHSDKTPDQLRLEKMDAVTAGLIDLILKPDTTDQQKGKLFERVTHWCKETGKHDLERIASMDKVAEHLLDLVGREETSDTQKGRLFGNVMAWYKVREKLVPSEDGDKLRSMSNVLKSKGGKGSANSRHRSDASGDGRAIRKLIGALPPYGGSARGNQARPERESGGAGGNGSGLHADGGSHDDRDMDGAGDGA